MAPKTGDFLISSCVMITPRNGSRLSAVGKPFGKSTKKVTVLQCAQLVKGISKEYVQLEKLEVGVWVTEVEAKRLSSANNLKILETRWVLTQKTPEVVRARLVAKDFRRLGLSSFREDLYSPTSGLETVRLALATASWFNFPLFSLDVSTAFLYALQEAERQCIRFPASVVDSKRKRNLYALT